MKGIGIFSSIQDESVETRKSEFSLDSNHDFWNILIVDDEDEVHRLTTMVLEDFCFENKKICFYHAYSAAEANEIIKKNPDIALVVLDIVMETDDAGFEVVQYIREKLNNKITQIILRTGQHGNAPEQDVMAEYEINSYFSKVELTASKLFTVVTASLRAYRLSYSLNHLNSKLENELNERKKNEKEVKRLNQFQLSVIDNADIWLHVLDYAGNLVIWNKTAERISGYTREEVLNSSKIWELLYPDKRKLEDITFKIDEMLNMGDSHFSFESSIKNKSGQVRVISWSFSRFDDENGKIVGLTALGRDVSEQKQLENQFLQAQKMEAIGRLAGGISHDFNNMLTVIRGYCELSLIKLNSDDPIFRKIGQIDRAAERAESLTQQLLAFSRNQVLTPKVLDLNNLVVEMQMMLERLITEEIVMTTRLDENSGNIKADSGQIEQVIMNLVVNSRDAMPDGGELTIKTENILLKDQNFIKNLKIKEGVYVQLSITDTGHGMNDETRNQIFEPFFTTKREGKGTGLGLSTVYGIVHQSGGYLSVESAPGEGTTVKVYFPSVESMEVISTDSIVSSNHFYGSETVLVVEDQYEVLQFTCEALQMYGYNVIEASDVNNAVSICKERKGEIDLVLTDVVMPVMSGIRFIEEVSGEIGDAKVLYMSGYTDNVVEKHGVLLKSGENYLQKPFTANELLKIIRYNFDNL